MSESEKDSFQRAMRKMDSRVKQRVDLALIELRKKYESLDREDRFKLRTWIEMVSETKDQMPSIAFLDISMKIEFSEQVDEDEYAKISLPILAIKNAIETWDRGEDYAPKHIGELIG